MLLGAVAVLATLSTAQANERNDINQVLKEVNYLQEVVRQLKYKHRNNRGKVRFNYDAMLAQLTAIRRGTEEYLNNDIKTLHVKPPAVVNPMLTKVRKN